MTNAEQTMAWLGMLFEPDDIFEVRVKEHDAKGAIQTWFKVREKAKQFAEVMAPIHETNNRHIWVGVCPRDGVGSTAPSLARALWADFDSTITTLEQAKQAIETSPLPPPTMLVNSGNGFHGYWKLDKAAAINAVKAYAKGVHQNLPADSTHDPTRVMRVPGTANVKDLENIKRCFIEEHHPERTYALELFPKAELLPDAARPGALPGRSRSTKLAKADFDTFVANWIDSQKHTMAVAVAGYLRKNLYYNQDECEAEIARIHNAAGYEMDANLRKVVQDTYDRPLAMAAGTTKLRDLGIVPTVRDAFVLHIKQRPKPRIEVIDFNEDGEDQEFWVDGLVGPGLLTMWAAEPKTGKSFAAMQMGYSLATGEPLWDFETDRRPHKVLYFQGELTMQMVRQRAKAMFGLNAVRNPKQFAMTAKPAKPINLVESPEVLTDLADGYDVVIIDPISIFNQNDETHSHSVNEVVGVFDSLRAEGKAVILVHHTRKMQTDKDGNPLNPSFNDIRGSGAWFATADALALHYRTGQDNNHTQVKFIYRAAPDREPLNLYRLTHGGFTADKQLYLETNPQFKVSFPASIN